MRHLAATSYISGSSHPEAPKHKMISLALRPIKFFNSIPQLTSLSKDSKPGMGRVEPFALSFAGKPAPGR